VMPVRSGRVNSSSTSYLRSCSNILQNYTTEPGTTTSAQVTADTGPSRTCIVGVLVFEHMFE
jgi:hypothetical protein